MIPQKIIDFAQANGINSSGYESPVKKALNFLADKAEKEIVKSQEYKNVLSEIERIDKLTDKTKLHIKMNGKIESIKSDIDWNEKRIARVEDRGELIQIAKDLKHREIENKRQEIFDEQVKKCIEFIERKNE